MKKHREPEAVLPIEQPDDSPIVYGSARPWRDRPTSEDLSPEALWRLLEAFRTLMRRGVGPESWAMPLTKDPLAFLLDAMLDAVSLREENGDLLYRNRASEALDLATREPVSYERLLIGQRSFERRCLRFHIEDTFFVLEVVSEIRET